MRGLAKVSVGVSRVVTVSSAGGPQRQRRHRGQPAALVPRGRAPARAPFSQPSSSAVRAEDPVSSPAPLSSDIPDAAIPQDVLEMFKEAQQRIIDLNQSRLYALEELAEARAKIIDLEERLSTAEKDALGMTLQVAKEAAEIKKSRELPGTESEDAGTARGAEEAEAAADNLEHDYDDFEDDVKSVGEAATGVISILYETAWEPAFIHFNCPEHSSWTDSPGMKMKTGELPNHKIFSITASSLEFVLNDGEYEWDKPSYDSNYFIGSPGSYILKSGKLEKVR
ncbi:hypothetical protein HKI87_11g66540 [Chloropicon roscoffensis]|uniref:Carbohydrate binding module family 25 domain-containing protein n=1 Tax=Chloropicon roscoffensis TaxID=1461544 RepID=A0AAX4PFU0_9CHLO